MKTIRILRVCVLLALACVRAAPCRADGERELRVTPELEAAVTRGLDYLAGTQQEDGSWPQQYGAVSGVVGLAMLAALAHGEIPGEGKYGPMMTRAVDYIVRQQQPNGLLVGRDQSSPMYSHGFATLALSEVYGQINDPRVGPALQKAVGLILTAQNRHGAWRYDVASQDADTTVSGAQMLALRAAAQAGFEVPLDAVRRGVAFYRSMHCPGGGFGYTNPSSPNVARSGIGLLVLSLAGEYRSDEARATADWLYTHLDHSDRQWFFYGAYYASQAMYQAGGKYWKRWNDTMTPRILAMQRSDGSWAAGSTSALVDTAFALLALEVNYNLLPIYQR